MTNDHRVAVRTGDFQDSWLPIELRGERF
jgi:hypothetical protein